MSFNTSQAHASNASAIDQSQKQVASLDNKYGAALIGNYGEEQDSLRDQLSRIYALMGALRVRAQELVLEQLEAHKARKDSTNRELAIA